MKKGIATVLVAVMAMSTLVGCGEPKVKGTPAVKVNSAVITQEAIDARFTQTCAIYGLDSADEKVSYIKDTVVEGLIDEQLLLQEAKKRNIKATDEEVKKLKDSVINQYPSKEEFEKNLSERMKMTVAEFDAMAKDQVIFDALMANETKDVKVDAQAYYNQNIESFYQEESAKASHILVATEEEAKAIITELDGGANFAELAKNKSTDKGSGATGGELGYFTKAEMVPEFSDAAFALEMGTYTKVPVKSQFGFHIIKLEDKKPAGQKTFDEVKDEISKQLLDQEKNKAYQTLLERLRKEATIEYLNKKDEPKADGAATDASKADGAATTATPSDQPKADGAATTDSNQPNATAK